MTRKWETGGSIDRALNFSTKLAERFIRAMTFADGRTKVTPERDRIDRLMRKLAVGLFVGHFGVLARLDEFEPAGYFPRSLEDGTSELIQLLKYGTYFKRPKWFVIQPHVFSYSVVRAKANRRPFLFILEFHRSLWAVVRIPDPAQVQGDNMNAQKSSDLDRRESPKSFDD